MTAGWRLSGLDEEGQPWKSAMSQTDVDVAFKAVEERSRKAAPREPKKKTGSFMSDRQIARAAVEGRKITFRTGVLVPMDGYVVGMDDYHWMIATPSDEDYGVQTTLIHKSCPLVTFTDEYLAGEIDEDCEAIRKIGGAFWSWCISSGLVRSASTR